jgi:hypothetical protein
MGAFPNTYVIRATRRPDGKIDAVFVHCMGGPPVVTGKGYADEQMMLAAGRRRLPEENFVIAWMDAAGELKA